MNHDTSRTAIELGPDIDEDDDCLDDGDCQTCHGHGGWSWDVEGRDGRDIEVDKDCPACGGTGAA